MINFVLIEGISLALHFKVMNTTLYDCANFNKANHHMESG